MTFIFGGKFPGLESEFRITLLEVWLDEAIGAVALTNL